MINITEAEAAERWCPFIARPTILALQGGSNCIASKCMAWRPASGAPAADREPRGRCGLAGL